LCSRHNAELFSKLAFNAGKYRELELSALDLTTSPHYAAYHATLANQQGRGGEAAAARLKVFVLALARTG